METFDAVVIGAGWAGLRAAADLAAAGWTVALADRSPEAGGRAAAKAPGGGAAEAVVDFGPVFVHGADPGFQAWVTGSGVEVDEGWPRTVRGQGTPCQPAAFDPLQRRWAVAGGLRSLALHLLQEFTAAHRGPWVPGFEAQSLRPGPEGWQIDAADGRQLRGRHLVLALAPEQARPLAAPVSPTADALLASFGSLPCLTVLARYPEGTPVPPWDVWYPEDSPSLLLLSNEGPKRRQAAGVWLTLQARPAWSRARLEIEKDLWGKEILDEAGRLAGPWAAAPEVWKAHRWKFGRLGPADHLARPLVTPVAGGSGLLALAGDLFDPAGGLEGAWLSGRRAAADLVRSARR